MRQLDCHSIDSSSSPCSCRVVMSNFFYFLFLCTKMLNTACSSWSRAEPLNFLKYFYTRARCQRLANQVILTAWLYRRRHCLPQTLGSGLQCPEIGCKCVQSSTELCSKQWLFCFWPLGRPHIKMSCHSVSCLLVRVSLDTLPFKGFFCTVKYGYVNKIHLN